MIGLNLGSGQRPFDTTKGWLNIDSQPSITVDGVTYTPDLVLDITKSLPFENDSVDIAVAHHSLEHMDAYREGQDFIREVHRVLKPGASFIVTVPDLKAMAKRWLLGQMDNYTYLTNLYGAWMGSEFDRHKHGYCWEELHGKMLSAAPWKSVKMFDWRVIAGADIAQDFWILGGEGIK